jgi:hypothetical protein
MVASIVGVYSLAIIMIHHDITVLVVVGRPELAGKACERKHNARYSGNLLPCFLVALKQTKPLTDALFSHHTNVHDEDAIVAKIIRRHLFRFHSSSSYDSPSVARILSSLLHFIIIAGDGWGEENGGGGGGGGRMNGSSVFYSRDPEAKGAVRRYLDGWPGRWMAFVQDLESGQSKPHGRKHHQRGWWRRRRAVLYS